MRREVNEQDVAVPTGRMSVLGCVDDCHAARTYPAFGRSLKPAGMCKCGAVWFDGRQLATLSVVVAAVLAIVLAITALVMSHDTIDPADRDASKTTQHRPRKGTPQVAVICNESRFLVLRHDASDRSSAVLQCSPLSTAADHRSRAASPPPRNPQSVKPVTRAPDGGRAGRPWRQRGCLLVCSHTAWRWP